MERIFPRSIVPLFVVAAFGWHANQAMATVECAEKTGVMILVGQDGLYLARPPSTRSFTRSMGLSLLGTALTGGKALIFFHPDRLGTGSSALVLEPYAASFRPALVASRLDEQLSIALAERNASDVAIMGGFSRGENVDQAIGDANCSRLLVINIVYFLLESRDGIELSMLAQLVEIPDRNEAEKHTIAVAEHYSVPHSFPLPNSSKNLGEATQDFMGRHGTEVEADFEYAILDVARMVARQLSPGLDLERARTILGKSAKAIFCEDCQRNDWLVSGLSGGRVWIEPAKHPGTLRSFASRAPPRDSGSQ